MSHYRELPPPAGLARFVSCVWLRHTSPGDRNLQPRVVPDGCADIVWIGDNPPVVAGPATTTIIPRLAPNTPIAGIRFRTGTAPCLLGLPASEIRDIEAQLGDIWSLDTSRLAEVAGGDPTPESMLAALCGELRGHLPDARPEDRAVLAAVAIVSREPATRVRDLSAQLGMSERQLRRRFEAAVGYGPKTLARVMRFQRALRMARRDRETGTDLASIAMLAGYADQAHMTREFSALAGESPGRLLKFA